MLWAVHQQGSWQGSATGGEQREALTTDRLPRSLSTSILALPTCPLSTLESWLLFRGELSPKAQPVQMGIEPRAPSCSPDPEEKRVSVGM